MRKVVVNLTKGYVTVVDEDDLERMSPHSWSYGNRNYALARIGNRPIPLHRFIMNCPPDMEVDHIDGNPLNNSKENLRLCNRSQNMANRCQRGSNNTSGYKGVTARRGGWMAQIVVKGRYIRIGDFKDKEAAAIAYNAVALQYHGEFARLNEVRL